MGRREAVKLIGLAGAASVVFGRGGRTARRPSIIIILIDDLGWKDIACAGSTYHRTPHIDRLAADGMMFLQGYASAPVCSPSRGALLSGKYPARTKLTTVWDGAQTADDRLMDVSKPLLSKMIMRGNAQYLEGRHRHALPASEYTFAEALRDAEYATGHIGKWHVGLHPGFRPQDQGFTFAEGHWKTPESIPWGHFGKDFSGQLAGMEQVKDDDFIPDILTDSAVRFIRTRKDKPFLLMLSHYAVHTPIRAKAADIETYRNLPTSDHNRADYAALVKSVDDNVGRIVAALKDTGLENDSVVIFTSDNGGLTTITSNYPLMGGKSLGYEAGMRVPWIVKWPGRVKPGAKESTRVIHTDIYPTLLDIAGLPLNPGQHVDGMSLMPLLTGSGKLPDRPLLFHFPNYTGYTGPFSSVIHHDWKLIRYYNDVDGRHQLFNLKKDPYELNDLVDSNPEKEKELSAVLDRLLKETGAELPLPNPNYDPAKPSTVTRHFPYSVSQRHRAEAERRLQESLLK